MIMQGAATAQHAGSEGLKPLSYSAWRRLPNIPQEQYLLCGDARRQKKSSVVLVVRCGSRARRTLKNKRHGLHPPQNHVLELVSALTSEVSDHYAALNYHSKSMVLSDWFLLLEELGRMNQWLLTLERRGARGYSVQAGPHGLQNIWDIVPENQRRRIFCKVNAKHLTTNSSTSNNSEVFRWMQEQKWYKPDDGFYAKIISILGKQGHLRLAIWLFKEMKKHGCRPDSSVLNSLINAHLRNTNNKEVALVKALGYYETMKKTRRCRPNLVTYNSLLRACAQAKQAEKMEELFKEMEQEGLKPDIYTFNGILDAHGKAGDFSEMEAVLKTMKENGISADCITFNTLIDTYGKAGIITKMEEALKAMAAAKVKPQLSTFNVLINNYGSAKRVEEMEMVFKKMSSMGVPPSLITYEVLMKGYGNCKCLGKIHSCLKEMYDAGFKLGVTTLNAAMEAYCTNGLFKEAERLLDNASDVGVVPTSLSYLILHRAYLKQGCVDKVETLLKRMEAAGIKPNEKFISPSLESVARESKWKEPTQAADLWRGNDARKQAAGLRRGSDSKKEAAEVHRGNDSRKETSSIDPNRAVVLHAS